MALCGKCEANIQDGVKFCPFCGHNENARSNKVMAILAYIAFLIPLLTGSYTRSSFVKYHTNQGAVLFIASLSFYVFFVILDLLLSYILPVNSDIKAVLYDIFNVFGWVINYGLRILGIINVMMSKAKPLPIIGKIIIVK